MSTSKRHAISAGALILLDHKGEKLLWAKRDPRMKFLGGNFSFPGGKVEEQDKNTIVHNCDDVELSESLACAVRETFEEVGVLVASGIDKLSLGQIRSLNDDIQSKRATFNEILRYWGLWIDANRFTYAGLWTTPEFSPVRFKTHFFLSVCPKKQEPYQASTEFCEIEFIEPAAAIKKWADSKVLIVPPILFALKELEVKENIENAAAKMRARSEAKNGNAPFIAINSRLKCVPLKTKTLPPATHTNCFIFGDREFIVIDPAAREQSEQAKLYRIVDQMIAEGGKCKAIIVSHHHADHFGGEIALKEYLKNAYAQDPSMITHHETAQRLNWKFEKYFEDREEIILRDKTDREFIVDALHMPGHARGHLCFFDREFGFLLSSDNVVEGGTVVISPPEGNMIDYFQSLKRMRDLTGLRFMWGSHGGAIYDPKAKITEYLSHRSARESQIAAIVSQGIEDPKEIVASIYVGLDSDLIPLAEKTVTAHLEKIRIEGAEKK